MLSVHLYFVKLFGCIINDSDEAISIDLSSFADSIIKGRHHPDLYLQFGCGTEFNGEGLTGQSDFMGENRNGSTVLGTVFYHVSGVTVAMFYSHGVTLSDRHGTYWHPKFNTGRITIGDFRIKGP